MIKAEQLGEKSVLFGIISALIYTAKQTYGGIVKDAGQETAVLATTVIILSIISLEFKLYETRKSINKSPISILIFLFFFIFISFGCSFHAFYSSKITSSQYSEEKNSLISRFSSLKGAAISSFEKEKKEKKLEISQIEQKKQALLTELRTGFGNEARKITKDLEKKYGIAFTNEDKNSLGDVGKRIDDYISKNYSDIQFYQDSIKNIETNIKGLENENASSESIKNFILQYNAVGNGLKNIFQNFNFENYLSDIDRIGTVSYTLATVANQSKLSDVNYSLLVTTILEFSPIILIFVSTSGATTRSRSVFRPPNPSDNDELSVLIDTKELKE